MLEAQGVGGWHRKGSARARVGRKKARAPVYKKKKTRTKLEIRQKLPPNELRLGRAQQSIATNVNMSIKSLANRVTSLANWVP